MEHASALRNSGALTVLCLLALMIARILDFATMGSAIAIPDLRDKTVPSRCAPTSALGMVSALLTT